MLPLEEVRTRQCVARGEEIAGRGGVEMRQEGMMGRAHSKAGRGEDTALTLCSLMLRSDADSI